MKVLLFLLISLFLVNAAYAVTDTELTAARERVDIIIANLNFMRNCMEVITSGKANLLGIEVPLDETIKSAIRQKYLDAKQQAVILFKELP